MNKKKYKPIKIKDCLSSKHIVRLLPGQDIVLELNHQLFPDATIQINGEYIYWMKMESEDDKDCFRIIQKDFVEDWSKISNTFLGEVWVESVNCSSRLEVILDCQHSRSHRKNVLTVVNPQSIDVKMKPHNVLEVVLFEEDCDQEAWEWRWQPNQNVDIELMAYKRLNIFPENRVENQTESVYPWCPRVKHFGRESIHQHHFWFRFERNIDSLFEWEESSVLNIGDLLFFGSTDKVYTKNLHFLGVHVDFRDVNFDKFTMSQNVPVMSLPCNFLTRKEKKPQLPKVYSVGLKEIDAFPMELGCQTLSPIPSQLAQNLMNCMNLPNCV